jgi:hypothetical protein
MLIPDPESGSATLQLYQYLTAWLRLVPEPQLLSKEPQPLLLIAPAVAAQDHLQALLPFCSTQQGLEGPAQFVKVPEADPALVLQIIASLVVAVVRREVGAVQVVTQDCGSAFISSGSGSNPDPGL